MQTRSTVGSAEGAGTLREGPDGGLEVAVELLLGVDDVRVPGPRGGLRALLASATERARLRRNSVHPCRVHSGRVGARSAGRNRAGKRAAALGLTRTLLLGQNMNPIA